MPLQDLTPPPVAPSRSDPPETFITRADEFLAWVATFGQQMGILVPQLEATAALIAAAPAYADPGLVALTGNTPAADKVPYYTGTGTSALAALTAAGRALIGAANAGLQLDALGLSANGKSLITAADFAAMRDLLHLVPGYDVQPFDVDLSALAGLVTAADKLPYFTDAHVAALATLTAFARTLLDDADAAAARGTLGIASAVQEESLGASGWRKWTSGLKETWGSITIAQDAYATYPLPIDHTSWVHPTAAISVIAGNTSDNQNTGMANIVVDGTGKPTGIRFWNANDATLTLYVNTRGV